MTHTPPARPTVVVLGGGYAGVQVARPLDDLADVVLVEPKDDFVHNVAALRALVDPSWLERIYLPYTGLLGRGRVIQDRAVKADADRVVLASGAELFPDYLVLATGSGYPFPAKPDLPGTEAAYGKVRSTHAALAAADRVLLLGAGPVGIELAGEIKAVWPGKQVTLVDVAGDVLGERYRPDLKAELRRQLTGLGAGMLLGSPLEAGPPTPAGELGTFTVTTRAGT
jgi:apoptosis-inducing factor 2